MMKLGPDNEPRNFTKPTSPSHMTNSRKTGRGGSETEPQAERATVESGENSGGRVLEGSRTMAGPVMPKCIGISRGFFPRKNTCHKKGFPFRSFISSLGDVDFAFSRLNAYLIRVETRMSIPSVSVIPCVMEMNIVGTQ